MPIERSAGAVIFRRERGIIKYLLLHYPRGVRRPSPYWDFPKGHVERGEKLIETAEREVTEETGLTNIKFFEGFKSWIKYFFKYKSKTVVKVVTFFLAETKIKKVKISFEHKGFKWLPYEKSLEQLTFNNAKEILKKADDFLSKKSLWGGKKNSQR